MSGASDPTDNAEQLAYDTGWREGYDEGRASGYDAGYDDGYGNGWDDCERDYELS